MTHKIFLEVKTLLMKLKVLGEIARESGANTRCMVIDLGSLDCRAGCSICGLEKVAKRMIDCFPSVEEGPGTYLLLLVLKNKSVNEIMKMRL